MSPQPLIWDDIPGVSRDNGIDVHVTRHVLRKHGSQIEMRRLGSKYLVHREQFRQVFSQLSAPYGSGPINAGLRRWHDERRARRAEQ